MLPDILFRTARIRQNGASFQIRQDLFHHRHNLQDWRTQKDNVRILDYCLNIRIGIVNGAKLHRVIHRSLRTAKTSDVDVFSHLLL